MNDRRKFSRIPTDQVICFSMVEDAKHLGIGKDVSRGGIRFEAVGCELDLGDTIRVTFNVGERSIEAVGEVVWAIESDPITLDIGLEFIEIDAEAARLLEEQLETIPSV